MKIIVTFLISIISVFGFSQNTYLKISEENKTSVSYPPGTKFVLTNEDGFIILKESDTPLVFKIDEPYTLEVFPSYKKEKDFYNLKKGKIELIYYSTYLTSVKHKKHTYQSNSVSLDNAAYSNSIINEGETNVALEFSNGMTFYYTDGVVSAELKNNEVEVIGHYLIYSKSGVVKISYNPKNKELWWVYEPK